MADLKVATTPPELMRGRRSRVRLLFSRDASGPSHDLEFESIRNLLETGDVLVFNLSATLPAEVTYGAVRVRYYDIHDTWCRFSATKEPPENILKNWGLRTLSDSTVGYESRRVILSHLFETGRAVADTDKVYPLECYRNTFSVIPGSAEFPSAARPFTFEVVQRLARSGVNLAFLTLHTATQIESETPAPEYFRVPHETVRLIEEAKAAGKRVLAIGTTCVRALESVDLGEHTADGVEGYTSLIVGHAHRLKIVDGLITGFHDPGSSHLELLCAFRRREVLSELYRRAAALGYKKGVFGDLCMLT